MAATLTTLTTPAELPAVTPKPDELIRIAYGAELIRLRQPKAYTRAWAPHESRIQKERPTTGLFFDSNDARVATAEEFEDFLGCLNEAKEVLAYAGPDANQVQLITARMPIGYCVKVGWIQARDIPDEHLKSGNIRMSGHKGGPLKMVCSKMEPFGVGAEGSVPVEIVRKYQCATFKVSNADGTLLSWWPGVAEHVQPCTSLEEQMVYLGGLCLPKPQPQQQQQQQQQRPAQTQQQRPAQQRVQRTQQPYRGPNRNRNVESDLYLDTRIQIAVSAALKAANITVV